MRSNDGPGGLGPWEFPWDRPRCFVLRDGEWHKGHVLQWFPPSERHPGWRAAVRYMVGTLQYHHSVTADEVKPRPIETPSWLR